MKLKLIILLLGLVIGYTAALKTLPVPVTFPVVQSQSGLAPPASAVSPNPEVSESEVPIASSELNTQSNTNEETPSVPVTTADIDAAEPANVANLSAEAWAAQAQQQLQLQISQHPLADQVRIDTILCQQWLCEVLGEAQSLATWHQLSQAVAQTTPGLILPEDTQPPLPFSAIKKGEGVWVYGLFRFAPVPSDELSEPEALDEAPRES